MADRTAKPPTVTGDYETFTPEELAECLSHYDIGRVKNIAEFPRGSRRSPKVVIDSSAGKFLFKRRAGGKDDQSKVAFAHQIQMKLIGEGFPVARLVPTGRHHSSMLVREGCIYEMFEYVEGQGYDGSAEATHHAGHTLGLYHKLLRDFHSGYEPTVGSYHDSAAIEQAIRNTVRSLPINARPPAAELNKTVEMLLKAYRYCAEGANKLSVHQWDIQIIHGDWHPGNMLFEGGKVVAVIDYDSVRLQQRVLDVANGALQFSIVTGDKNPAKWPANVDKDRFEHFLRGYSDVGGTGADEAKAIPRLMCEAIIAEAVLPIAATGTFGRMGGFAFLQVVGRKVNWILHHMQELCDLVKVSQEP